MQDLIITIVQSELVWENPEQSRKHLDTHLHRINAGTNLVVLPEMFTTGFSMDPQRVAEKFHPTEMKTLKWMQTWASRLNAVMTGSVAVEDKGHYYNRLLWVKPDGSFSSYDKRHLFRMAGEHEKYISGQSLLVEEILGWRICPLVCYDLRFPVWSRNRLIEHKPLYDVLVYVANWPSVRKEVWKKLLLARSIENQCYTIGLNRVGKDGNGHQYDGDSAFINPRGEYMQAADKPEEGVFTQMLLWHDLKEFRENFPVLDDADRFEIEAQE